MSAESINTIYGDVLNLLQSLGVSEFEVLHCQSVKETSKILEEYDKNLKTFKAVCIAHLKLIYNITDRSEP